MGEDKEIFTDEDLASLPPDEVRELLKRAAESADPAASFRNYLRPTSPASSPEPATRSLIVPIQMSGSAPPIFAIHNLGEQGLMFSDLAKELGTEQPIIGLGAPHRLVPYWRESYDPTALRDVESIAAAYADEIERLAPTGPFCLLGMCGGAVIAYEVAQIMQTRHREPEAFIMLSDWHAPFLGMTESISADIRHTFTVMPRPRWRFLLARLPKVVTAGWDVARGPLERAELQIRRRFSLPMPHRLHVREYLEESLDSLHTYDYLPYGGTVLIVRGADDRRFQSEATGWGDLLSNHRLITSPGISASMLEPPHVTELAATIRSVLPPTQSRVKQ